MKVGHQLADDRPDVIGNVEMVLTNLKATGPPIRVVSEGDGVALIVNRDLTNPVIYGPDTSIANQNLNEYSIIDPLGSITVTGDQDVWVMAQTGQPTIDVVPGSGFWSPSPAQIAAQIAALGLATAGNQTTQ